MNDPDPADGLSRARLAVQRRRWREAAELYSVVAPAGELGAGDLRAFADARFWTSRAEESISLREAAYAAFVDAGEIDDAAMCALALRRQHLWDLRDSVADGWLRRAERLLDGRPESFSDTSRAEGHLAIAHADDARARGAFAEAFALVDRASRIAERTGDVDLRAWALIRRGRFLVDEGRTAEGRSLLDEAAAVVAGGELDGYATGAVLTNVMAGCLDTADYQRGLQWADVAQRWCEREGLRGLAGICRIHRAALLRMQGALRRAEEEAARACDEVRGFSLVHTAAAQHELGEVRLRLGDLAGAGEAFEAAQQAGVDPQPGLALLRRAQGDITAALASIEWALEQVGADGFARARALAARAEIAAAAGDRKLVQRAADEVTDLAAQLPTTAVRAASDWARGLLGLVDGDLDAASGHLTEAKAAWTAASAPFEGAKVDIALAEVDLALGDRAAATARLDTAFGTLDRLGARHEAARASELRRRIGRGDSPIRTVRTFLFTDIVGSTSLISLIGDEAWDDLRRWHDQVLRTCFVDHGGEEIDHAGDGFFVAFPDVPSAVASAVEIQRRLFDHRRSNGFAPQVRIGLHTTAATSDGGDYTGLGVHTAARIGGIADAGEILASAETASQAQGTPTSGPRTVELKGLAEPIDIVAIDWR